MDVDICSAWAKSGLIVTKWRQRVTRKLWCLSVREKGGFRRILTFCSSRKWSHFAVVVTRYMGRGESVTPFMFYVNFGRFGSNQSYRENSPTRTFRMMVLRSITAFILPGGMGKVVSVTTSSSIVAFWTQFVTRSI